MGSDGVAWRGAVYMAVETDEVSDRESQSEESER